jgi:DNA repair ATPase RecN
MKRACLFAVVGLLSLAQRSRDDYREAYRAWRQTDPNLERDAAEGESVAQRADRLAAAAVKFAAARKSYLDVLAQDESEQISWLENAVPSAEARAASTKTDTQFLATETAAVTRTIGAFSNDPDKGIRQLRQALARERAALEALGPLLTQRKKAADAVSAATAGLIPRGPRRSNSRATCWTH